MLRIVKVFIILLISFLQSGYGWKDYPDITPIEEVSEQKVMSLLSRISGVFESFDGTLLFVNESNLNLDIRYLLSNSTLVVGYKDFGMDLTIEPARIERNNAYLGQSITETSFYFSTNGVHKLEISTNRFKTRKLVVEVSLEIVPPGLLRHNYSRTFYKRSSFLFGSWIVDKTSDLSIRHSTPKESQTYTKRSNDLADTKELAGNRNASVKRSSTQLKSKTSNEPFKVLKFDKNRHRYCRNMFLQ